MTIKMPDEFEECEGKETETLDGGDTEENLEIAAAVISGVSELSLGVAGAIAPAKLDEMLTKQAMNPKPEKPKVVIPANNP